MNRIVINFVRALGISLLMGASYCTCTVSYNYYDECAAGVPYDQCYVTRRDPESEQVAMASAIGLQWIEENPPEEEAWDWKSGVLMFGLTELYRVTGDERFRDYYQAWMDHHIAQGYALVWSDSCPPAITAISLLSETSTDEYQQVVDKTLEYLDEVAPRTAEGGISHNGVLGQKSIWLDSLFMFGMVLNRWGELTEDSSRLDMFSEQAKIFAEQLQDDNGFMRHAQDWPGADESVYWARGNGWVVASLADYLRIRVRRNENDPEVREVLRKQVKALVGVQDSETGLWWSIVNRPDLAYRETSGSALFAYGIARAWRYGVLDDSDLDVARKAMEGVRQNILTAGSEYLVRGVSLATDPWSLEEYAAVPVADDINYGVGTVILALIETSGLPD